MATLRRMCSLLCDTVGIKVLLLRPNQEKIEDRLTIAARQRRESAATRKKRKDLGKIKERMKWYQEEERRHSIVILGQNVIGESVPDIAKKLVKRDYEPIANFNGDQEEELGATFVPEGHVPKNPRIVMPEWRDQIEGPFQDDPNFMGELDQAIGDMAEKEAYDALRDYFKEKGEAVVIINGLEMLELDLERRRVKDKREIDFLIINYTHHYIMDMEVKKSLHNERGQNDSLSPIESAQEQLQECKEYFEEWFGADLSSNWRFMGSVFCMSQDDRVNFCDDCQEFIIIGPHQLPQKMDKMVQNLRHARPQFQKSPEEFKMMVTYTLYCTAVVELPLKGNYPTRVHKAIQQAGSVENIKIWCFPTPGQRMALEQSQSGLCCTLGVRQDTFNDCQGH